MAYRKKKGRTTLFPTWLQILVAAALRPHELRELVHICMRLLNATQTTPSWTQIYGKTSISLLLTRLNCIYEFLVSKETVVLRRWERSKQKFGFIKRVDKG